eukprot:g19813.t1
MNKEKKAHEVLLKLNHKSRSTDDAIFLALHSSLEHLDNKGIYVRLLLVDYSSVFYTIIPSRLISKLRDLGLSSAPCNWILSFLIHSEGSKTKGLIIDFRKKGEEHASIYTNETEVERVKSIKFLSVTITDDQSWPSHVDATVKKAQQCLFFLRRFRKFGIFIRSVINFYKCTIESILSGYTMAWYGNCSAQDCKKLQKVTCTVQTITEANLPPMDSTYIAHCHGKAANIIKDP